MKKLLLLSTVLLLGLAACSTDDDEPQQPTQGGVIINGIEWATRNVDMPGTFAENPEDTGMIFQWNRRKGWNATDEEVEDWDSSMPTGTKWYTKNDPCPTGWRVPTQAELLSLINSNSIWITKNGVNGRLFGRAPNQIFLPITGMRSSGIGGLLVAVGMSVSYWSNTRMNGYDMAMSIHLWYDDEGWWSNMTWGYSWLPNGHPVRCVAE